MVIVLPPGEMQPLICEDCKGTTFTLKQEVRDGRVDAFHTLCTGCGKRGAISFNVETVVTRKFDQFMDPPGGWPPGWQPASGSYTVVEGPVEPGVTTVTTTAPSVADPDEQC